jgi:hypothetical protein
MPLPVEVSTSTRCAGRGNAVEGQHSL